jgi:hypothetical protein
MDNDGVLILTKQVVVFFFTGSGGVILLLRDFFIGLFLTSVLKFFLYTKLLGCS